MINNNLLVALTENDKRFIFALLLLIILLFVIIGYLGLLITRVMKWQGKKMDTLCHDVIVTKVITNKKDLFKYGIKKNWRLFFSQAIIPMIIIVAAITLLLIYDGVTHNWGYNPFSVENGFGSLFFTFELTDQYVGWWIFAFRVIKVSHYPTFVASAWCGYIFCPLILVGGCWYLVTVQCLISRTIRLYTLSKSVFEKSLDGYTQAVKPEDLKGQTVDNNQNNNNSLNN